MDPENELTADPAPPDPKPDERKSKERLARPPKDRREVIIGPTNGNGPDVTLEG
jgi:hypothetical protein